MNSFSFYHKKWHFTALLLFSIVLSGGILLWPTPELSDSPSNIVGLLANILTGSAGPPYFLVSAGILSLIPLLMKLQRKAIVYLWLQFALLLVLSFIAKTALKQFTEVPRPYSHELQRLHLVESSQAFYELDQQAKDRVVEQAAVSVSHWRIKHWQGETDYSFPSGHTLFVAVCVVFWGGCFLRRRQYLLAAVVIAWATGVGLSRIWLGMHWPSDLMASLACAGVLYCFIPEPFSENKRKRWRKEKYLPVQ